MSLVCLVHLHQEPVFLSCPSILLRTPASGENYGDSEASVYLLDVFFHSQ